MLKKLRNKLLVINLISMALITILTFSAIYLSFEKAIFSEAKEAIEDALDNFSYVRTAFLPDIPSSSDFDVQVSIFTEYPASRNIIFKTQSLSDGTQIIAQCDISEQRKTLNRLLFILTLAGLCFIALTGAVSKVIADNAIRPVKKSFDAQRQFVSDASHELKTPLSVINANLDVITPTKEQTRWYDNIRSETDRMIRLTRLLLNLTENNTLPKTEVCLSDICRSAVLTAETLAYEKEITVMEDIKGDICISGNRERLEQLIFILMDNAIKYNLKGGYIRVCLDKKRGSVYLSVENTGQTISPENYEKIFRRFYKGDSSRGSEGFGLGLSIAREIASAHNGKITVKSDKTTTFTVKFVH